MLLYEHKYKGRFSYLHQCTFKKSLSLKKCAGNFDRIIQLKVERTEELDWWLRQIAIAKRKTFSPDTDLIFHTDVSDSGWEVKDDKNPSKTRWNPKHPSCC